MLGVTGWLNKEPKRGNTMAKAKDKANMACATIESNDWRVQSDLDTYLRWREIKRDKKRLQAVKELAKEKLTDYATIAGSESDNDSDD